MFKSALCHQATFIRIETLRRLPYDESLSIVADWKHMFQLLVIEDGTYQHLDITICEYDNTGFSTINWQTLADEREYVLSKLLPIRVIGDYSVFLQNEKIFNCSPKLYQLVSKIKCGTIDEKVVVASIKILEFLRCVKKLLRL